MYETGRLRQTWLPWRHTYKNRHYRPRYEGGSFSCRLRTPADSVFTGGRQKWHRVKKTNPPVTACDYSQPLKAFRRKKPSDVTDQTMGLMAYFAHCIYSTGKGDQITYTVFPSIKARGSDFFLLKLFKIYPAWKRATIQWPGVYSTI